MTNSIVMTAEEVELFEIALQINDTLKSAELKFKQGMGDVCLVGELLIDAKDKVKRVGCGWVDWTEDNLDITRQQATKYMRVARRSNELLEKESPLSISNFSIEGATKYLAAIDREAKGERSREVASVPQDWLGEFQINKIYVADTTELSFLDSLPNNNVDMIFTDPPWDEDALICYEAIGRLANHILKPGGWCAVYCGKMFLPDVMHILGQWLDYEWTMCVFQPDNQMKINKLHLFGAWRPIVLYRKPGEKRFPEWVPDAYKSTREKQYHDWQQGHQPIQKYIEAFTLENELVLDPFVGGGTIPWVCQNLRRNFIAFDKNPESVAKSLDRLNGNTNF